MNIAINTYPLYSGHKERGVGRYTSQLIDALERYESGHTYTLFSDVQKPPKNTNLVHYPFFDPFFLTLPFFRSKPTVVTVHDLIPIVFSDHFPRGMKGEIKWQIQKQSLRGVQRIIADSQSTKNDIVKILGYKTDAIDVVYLASSISAGLPIKPKRSVVKTLKYPYIMYVGDVNWNKNITGLLNAYSVIQKKHSSVHLLLVGASFLNTEIPETRKIHTLIKKLGIPDHVHMTGFVTNDELIAHYERAIVTVLPSHYEGFGLPVLDAFTCGSPVVTSDNSSLKEISGPALLCDSNRIDSIASSIEAILALSQPQRKELIEKGYKWVNDFTWEKVAHDTVKSYEKIM